MNFLLVEKRLKPNHIPHVKPMVITAADKSDALHLKYQINMHRLDQLTFLSCKLTLLQKKSTITQVILKMKIRFAVKTLSNLATLYLIYINKSTF